MFGSRGGGLSRHSHHHSCWWTSGVFIFEWTYSPTPWWRWYQIGTMCAASPHGSGTTRNVKKRFTWLTLKHYNPQTQQISKTSEIPQTTSCSSQTFPNLPFFEHHQSSCSLARLRHEASLHIHPVFFQLKWVHPFFCSYQGHIKTRAHIQKCAFNPYTGNKFGFIVIVRSCCLSAAQGLTNSHQPKCDH